MDLSRRPDRARRCLVLGNSCEPSLRPEVGLGFPKKKVGDRVLRRSVRNSHSRCGCGGAQVFDCVDDPMPTVERRRLTTLDDREDRGRDRGPGERPEVEVEFSDPTSGRNNKSDPTSGRKKKLTDGDDRKKNEAKEKRRQRDRRKT